MPDKDPDVRIAIQHSIKMIGMWTAALYIVVALFLTAALVYASAERNRISDHVQETTTALCTFENDLERRRDASREFLDRHRGGVAGISAEEIRESIRNQTRTLHSLRSLPCEKGDFET